MIDWIRSHPALSAHRLAPLAVLAVFFAAAAAGGVVVGSGNLVLIALAVGVIIGTLLLSQAALVITIVLAGTLMITGPLVMHVPAAVRIQWLFSVLGFLLCGAAVLFAGAQRDLNRAPMPVFVWMALAFITYAVGMLVISDGSFGQAVSAIKRYFQYWGLMFAFAVIAFTPQRIASWLKFLLFIAMLQLPLSIYQFLILVPQRLTTPGVTPIDIVVGTFEGQIEGGGFNNVMVFFVVVIGAGLLALYREGLLRGWRFWVPFGVCLGPLALGETKTALVLLPIALGVVFADNIRRRPFAFAGGALVTAAVVAGLGYLYLVGPAVNHGREVSLERAIESNLEYNVGNEGYFGGVSLNRSTAIPFWWSQHWPRDVEGMVVGHGLGSTAGRTGAVGESGGEMDRRFPTLVIGILTATALLWDVGIVGFSMFMMILGGGVVTAIRLVWRSTPGLDRAVCRTLLASAVMLIPMVFHSDALINAPSMQVLMVLTLGLIAWRARVPAATPRRGNG